MKIMGEKAIFNKGERIMNDTCPKCGSHNPKLHPAVQHEGEVQICSDSYHLADEAIGKTGFIDHASKGKLTMTEVRIMEASQKHQGHPEEMHREFVGLSPMPSASACYASHQKWWYETGSGLRPLDGEDQEKHVHRVTQDAFMAGVYYIEAYKNLWAAKRDAERACKEDEANEQ